MGTFVRAVLVSLALTSASLTAASLASACPIDLAPCDEISTLHDVPILISLPSDGALSGVGAGEEGITRLQIVLLDHEGDDHGAADLVTGSISQQDDAGAELAEPLPITGTEVAAAHSREFLWGDELVQFDDGPSSVGFELAVDGYEDR